MSDCEIELLKLITIGQAHQIRGVATIQTVADQMHGLLDFCPLQFRAFRC